MLRADPDLIEAEVDDLRADVPQVGAHLQSVVDEGAQLLITDGVPHPVTGENQELVCRRALYHTHLWLWRHHLLAGGPILGPLVAEVPQSAGHCQRSVNPLDGHRASSALNALLFQRAVGFVVFCGEADLARATQHGPGVTTVGKVDVIRRDESSHHSGATPLPTFSAGYIVQMLVCLQEALNDGCFHLFRVILWSHSTCRSNQTWCWSTPSIPWKHNKDNKDNGKITTTLPKRRPWLGLTMQQRKISFIWYIYI